MHPSEPDHNSQSLQKIGKEKGKDEEAAVLLLNERYRQNGEMY
jgi:hypothetical protein